MAVPIDAQRCRAIFSFTRCTGYENHQGDHSFRSDEGVIYIRPGESVVGFTEDPNNPKCEHGWFEGRYIKWCNRPASHTGDHYFQKPDSDDPAGQQAHLSVAQQIRLKIFESLAETVGAADLNEFATVLLKISYIIEHGVPKEDL